MDIKKFLPRKEEGENKEYFWSLVIEPVWVQAGIWRIDEDKARVMLSSPPFAWESDEDLIQAVDNALSSAIQDFPEDLAEPSKTVFGVSSSWVEGGQISSEKLEKIKKICSDLSLLPIGFVVIPEAIAHFFKSEEGSPLNAIVLGIYKDTLEITLFKLGSLGGSTKVARSVSIVDDVSEGLTRFGVKDAFPSRLLLYDGKEGELEEVRQSLLKVNWEDYGNIKFLHTPKIEIIDPKKKVHTVSLAGASELADISGITIDSKTDEERLPESGEESEDLGKVSPDELGFKVGEDISAKRPEKDAIFVSKNVNEDDYHKAHEKPFEYDKEHYNLKEVEIKKEKNKKFYLPKFKLPDTQFLEKKLSFLGLRLRSLKFPLKLGSNQTFNFGLGFIILILVLGFVGWWFYPKAVVTVYVSPQKLEEKFEVKVNTGSSTSNISERELGAQMIEASISGDKTKDTTGTKTVGDKAKGEVTLYRSGSKVTLSSGTTLYGPEGLKFTLDSEVSLASGSAGSAGTTNASVTAEDIGAQYNLASGTSFSVGNYPITDIEAKNNSSFSGGSSREITAVSVEDQNILEEDLEKELEEKGINELLTKLSEEGMLIEDLVTATASSRTFSSKVGDESQSLKLTMKINSRGIVINKNELVEISQEALKTKVPQGFVLRGEQIGFEFNLKNREKEVYTFEVRVSVNLLPEIKTDEIIEKIRGKYPNLAEEYFKKDVAGFVRAEIQIKPVLPAKLKTLPHYRKNIEVEIAADR